MKTICFLSRAWLFIILAASLCGCALNPFNQRTAVPVALANTVKPNGLSSSSKDIFRIWGDVLDKETAEKINQEKVGPIVQPSGRAKGGRPVFHYLALSGGGPDGAFGAGLLSGWSKSGKRPNFSVVTGISTGALMAPFAFLGPKYDRYITKFYTKYSSKDLLIEQPFSALFGAPAVADSTPLKNLIAKFITPWLLKRIAREYKKGRILLVGTTNLDAQRPVIWNMGAIAAHGTPESLQLFRDILLASASIPGAFPPVMIKANIHGQSFHEMHVDGSITKQIFFAPQQLSVRHNEKRFKRKPIHRIYVVRNAKTAPQNEKVENEIVAIAGRSILTLMKFYARSNLNEIYQVARRDGIEYNLAMIPPSFKHELKEPFDLDYMRALYKVGYEQGRKGYQWADAPPDFANVTTRTARR